MSFDFFDEMLRDQREGPLTKLTLVEGDSRGITPPHGISLLWTDPPFGTGKTWTEEEGSYKDTDVEGAISLTIDVVTKWRPMMLPDAAVCICLDDRTIHDVVYLLKKEHGFFFRGEIIWTFGLGRPRTSWWPRRHNTIATFTLSPDSGRFDHSTVPREPRHEKHVPTLRYPETKPCGSVWNKTMSNTDGERVGYPNQKPLSVVTPFVKAHTLPGELVVDPFLGSGTTAEAAIQNRRLFFGCDQNPESLAVTRERVRKLW